MMRLLPIVVRELALACRRPVTYRVRSGMALITMVLLLGMLLTSRRSNPQLGREIFTVLSLWAFAYALLSGVRCTADTISSEKREGTLGLLFLTTLRGYDVVLGKLVVTSLEAAYGLVALLPMLAIPLLLGSVSGTEFWQMNLLLLNTLLFSLTVGLVISTFGREERGVMLGTFFVLLAFTFGLPLLWRAATRLLDIRVFDLLLLPSPAYAFKNTLSSTFRLASREYWLCILSMAAVWLGGIVLSSCSLPRLFQEKSQVRPNRWLRGVDRWRFGHRQSRYPRGESQIQGQPFLWLLTRDRLPRFWLGLLTMVTIFFALWAPSAFVRPSTPATPIAMFGAFGLHLVWKLLVAAEASRRLSLDKKSGALELLLATPLPVPSILVSQLTSLRWRFLLPFLALALLNYLIWITILQRNDDMPGSGLGGILLAIFDFHALSWVGMLASLREKSYVRAVFWSFAAVMAFPWVAMIVFVFAANALSINSSTAKAFFFYWYLFSAVYDLALAGWAKAQLLSRFRLLAADSVRPPRWLEFTPRPFPPPIPPRIEQARVN